MTKEEVRTLALSKLHSLPTTPSGMWARVPGRCPSRGALASPGQLGLRNRAEQAALELMAQNKGQIRRGQFKLVAGGRHPGALQPLPAPPDRVFLGHLRQPGGDSGYRLRQKPRRQGGGHRRRDAGDLVECHRAL